jgi:hypothetical protein
MDYIIINFHAPNCYNLEQKIKKAVFPFNIYHSFNISSLSLILSTRTGFYHNKFKHIIDDKQFYNKLQFVNYSKFLNANIHIFETQKSNSKKIVLQEWNNLGKTIKYSVEKTYSIKNNTVLIVKEYTWNNELQKVNVTKTVTFNRDWENSVHERYLKDSFPK